MVRWSPTHRRASGGLDFTTGGIAILTTSYRLARDHGACDAEVAKLVRHLGGDIDAFGRDTPVPLATVLDVCGLNAALWALQAVPPEQEAERDRIGRLFAADCAARVLSIFERERPDDRRTRAAIVAARRFAAGEISREELAAASAATWAARAAARAAAWDAAGYAAGAAAKAAAKAAAWAAAWDAAWAAAWYAAGYAAGYAARAAAWDAQKELFLAWLEGRAEPIALPPEPAAIPQEATS